MPEYTHQKKPYKANALQWGELNTVEIIDVLHSIGAEATRYGPDHILVRHSGTIDTLVVGSWVVRGENGQVKCYTNSEFNIKYEAL